MTSRALRGHRLSSDFPRVLILLVWVAFGLSIAFYFDGWLPLQREIAVRPQSSNVNKNDADKLYVGSIILAPTRGDKCRELMLDNRTGNMWDKGYINCFDAVHNTRRSTMSAERMLAIGKALRHGDN